VETDRPQGGPFVHLNLRSYRLPLPFEQLVVISDDFHLKPPLPFFASDGRFYILALSQNQVRLLEGIRYKGARSCSPCSSVSLLRSGDEYSQRDGDLASICTTDFPPTFWVAFNGCAASK
jgi:hypothetical protein